MVGWDGGRAGKEGGQGRRYDGTVVEQGKREDREGDMMGWWQDGKEV